ncbi:MAG: polysaccharide deacetylase family protein [Proteobacteria bacterium]|nr:polysaccharide deacetylase family protein [Pseudomonadota bacterium]
MYHLIEGKHLPAARFIWQLEFLRKHFEPIPLGEMVERVRAGALTGREVSLTFDDGVRNHFNVVWPLLQRHGMPATFFVCSDLIESDAWMWRSELRQRLALLDEDERTLLARNACCDARGVDQIMEWTKTLSMPDRRAFQNDVAEHTGQFAPSSDQIELHAPMTWAQLRQMDERLVTIGSHTRTHPVLTTLSDGELHDEILGSQRVLEQNLGRRVDLFSYPNGANNPAIVDLVRKHYRAAVSTRKDFLHPDADPFLLPRISAEGSRAMFVRRLHRPRS